MKDDNLKEQLEDWLVPADAMGLAITLCLKYGVEFVGNFIETTPSIYREDPDKFKDNIVINDIPKLLQLEKELESKFLFKTSNWSEITHAFCEIFNFHTVGDWVFDEDELISRLEKKDFICIYTEDKEYYVTLGYKAKPDFEKLMRDGYSKHIKDQNWWISLKNK